MRLEKIGRLELVYTDMDVEFPHAEGGQVYGILTGTLDAGSLRGSIHATNLARHRPDNVFTPALRGILSTPEGTKVFFTMDGLSVPDAKANPPRRIVTTGITLFSPEERFRPWNESYLLAELVGGAVGASWGVVGDLYRCVSEL